MKCSYVLQVIPISAVTWSPDRRALRYLDQRQLPLREVVTDVRALDDVIAAIQCLAIRGAPAIGVAAAIGLVVALDEATGGESAGIRTLLPGFAKQLAAARPTAVNLAWAVDRIVTRAAGESDDGLWNALQNEADRILREDIAMCQAIGQRGEVLVSNGARVLTHCNAGALATAGIGTALAPIYTAHDMGRAVHVFACETRPLRQGARLTAWELQRAGIAVTVLPDSAVASLLRAGDIDLVIVGADRIAANGDVANKIGTYSIALAAMTHDVPFYVAAPWSTMDLNTATGTDILIELRHRDELGDVPPNAEVWNPAFDVTPRALITAYLTDRGLVQPPFSMND